MIEYYNENIWYKKRPKKKRRFFGIFFTFILIFGFLAYYRFVITEQIFALCGDYAYAYSADAVNKTVLYSLDQEIKYTDLITVEKNSAGDIVLMTTNSRKVNTINREVADNCQTLLGKKMEGGIPVPWLSFTGISLLAGYGRPIMFKSLSVVSVVSEFTSKFTGMGINQTLHSIYIVVKSRVKINMPLNSREEECETSVLISETVLVGKVPEIYLNGKIFG